jgi:3-methyladenine DNA glycosylase AlkC
MVLAPKWLCDAHPVVLWGVRDPAFHQFDAALSKTFSLYERLNLQVRVNAIQRFQPSLAVNVFNHPIWQNDSNSTANDLSMK